MRKILLAGVALGLLIYMAGPLWAGWQLRQAMRARDLVALDVLVDWPLLRANLKPRIAGAVRENADASGVIGGAIKRALGATVADMAVDTFVTPANLSRILAGRAFVLEKFPGTAKPAAGAQPTAVDDDADVADDPMPPRRLRWAFFENLTRFRVEAVHPRLPNSRIAAILALEGVRWKLVDVDLVKR